MSNTPGALIAMSGGVDSTVAAYLMKQAGCRCMGATMRLYQNEDLGQSGFHTCCSVSYTHLAAPRRICRKARQYELSAGHRHPRERP